MSSEDRSDKFGWSAEDVVPSQCAYCKHLSAGPGAACAAFPGVIPAEILSNDFDHRNPWIDPETGEPGDRGIALERSILFEPRPEVPRSALDQIYRHLDGIGIEA